MTRAENPGILDWAIVGGGIHGVHVALRLLDEGRVRPESLTIVDPAERLLARWRECTEVTGMAYLRSPSVHHIGPTPTCLLHFAGKRKNRQLGLFAPPYNRPLLALFNAHCDHLIDSARLDERHVRGRVEECAADRDRVTLQLTDGRELTARNVVLALGASEEPHWPDWAPRDPRLHHVFAPGFNGWPVGEAETVAVIGGGISAAQVAVRLAAEAHKVVLISRHALREHQFDSDPGWLGPKYMARFQRTRDLSRRRAMIAEARHRGSLPPDVRRALQHSMDRGRVTRHEASVERCEPHADGLRIHLSSDSVVEAQRVLMATGYTPTRPGGRLVDGLIESARLPCAPCGFPVVDSALRWHPRVHVTGPLAELELGPSSRTIAGARRAADRIVSAQLEENPNVPQAFAS